MKIMSKSASQRKVHNDSQSIEMRADDDTIIRQQLKAIGAGAYQVYLELLKSIPPLKYLVAGLNGYEDYFIREQRVNLITEILQRIDALEDALESPWYQTSEGEEILKKTIASALNAEYAEKIEFFANITINGPQDIEQLEKLKFIDMVRQLSKASLRVLAVAVMIHNSAHGLHQIGQLIGTAASDTGLRDRDSVKACINELIAVGLLQQNGSHVSASDFTVRFVNFIKDPRIEK